MARDFDGDEQYGKTAAAIDLSGVNKLTLSFWLYWPSYATDSDVALEFSANYNTTNGGFVIVPNRSDGNFQVGLSGATGLCRTYFTRPSAAAWHNYVCLFDKSKSSQEVDSVYVDNSTVSLTYEVDSNNSDNFANDTLYFMSRAGTSLFGTGRLCEVAIWPGVLLDAGEIKSLSLGISPILVRPTAKPYYWPIYGHPTTNTANTTDHEPELFYGATMDLFGDATHIPPPPIAGP